MKDIFETVLANNKARTVVTVLATTVIVIACIGIGSTLAGSKSSDNSKAAKEPNIVASETTDAAAKVTTDDAVDTADVQKNGTHNSTTGSSGSDTSSRNSTSTTNNSDNSNGNYIGKAKAKSIALAEVGGGKVVSCHLDYDDGIAEYDIEIIWGDYEYELEINAKSGKITDFEKERIDHDDHDDHDYHHDDYDD